MAVPTTSFRWNGDQTYWLRPCGCRRRRRRRRWRARPAPLVGEKDVVQLSDGLTPEMAVRRRSIPRLPRRSGRIPLLPCLCGEHLPGWCEISWFCNRSQVEGKSPSLPFGLILRDTDKTECGACRFLLCISMRWAPFALRPDPARPEPGESLLLVPKWVSISWRNVAA